MPEQYIHNFDREIKFLKPTRGLTRESFAYDQEVDWRTQGVMGPIKNQYSYGSCVEHALVAMLEAMTKILLNKEVVLSDADLYFCSSHGATDDISAYWTPENAMYGAAFRGVCLQERFPNEETIPAPICIRDPNRNVGAIQIAEWASFASAAQAKHHLTTVGPLMALLRNYSDWGSLYRYTGVYSHANDGGIINHAMCIVGYSESGQYWICKNSWGPTWGDKGYIKIAYGSCYIDATQQYVITGVQDYVPVPIKFEWPFKSYLNYFAMLITPYMIESMTDWEVNSDADWVSFSANTKLKGGAALTIETETNPTPCPRAALISFYDDESNVVKEAILIQQGNPMV